MVVGASQYRSDYLIVGAGFTGLCCALRVLEQRPGCNVTILDADVAGGATALRSSAMFMRFGFSPLSRQMTQDSNDFYNALTGFEPEVWESHPFYWVLDDSPGSTQRDCLLCDVTTPAVADSARIKAQIPGLKLEKNEVIVFDPSVHRANPRILHSVLLSAALETGHVRLIEGCPATRLRDLGSRGIGVATDFGEFISPEVAICIAGAVQSPPFGRFFEQNKIRAKKIVSFYIPFADGAEASVGFGFMSDEVYLMPDIDKGRWILSITSHEWDVDVHGQRLTFTADELHAARSYIANRMGMDDACIMGAAVYGDAYAPVSVPLVLRPTEFGGKLSIATGTAGYGLKIAPALARAVTEVNYELP